jgi:3-keto-5-aminohexanoate cleavage enzyme
LSWLKSERIAPQFILYAPEEASALAVLQRRGIVPFEDVSVLYVLGRYTPGQYSTPADLLPFLAPKRPRFPHWMVCAFGRDETACVTAGALLGGHARVGFENNFVLPSGATATDNAALVASATVALEACGLRTANGDQLRAAWSGQF